MINGVELVFLDQTLQMGKFQCDHPVWRQQTRHSSGEVIEIGHLRQYIVADNEVGHVAFRDKTPSET